MKNHVKTADPIKRRVLVIGVVGQVTTRQIVTQEHIRMVIHWILIANQMRILISGASDSSERSASLHPRCYAPQSSRPAEES